MIQQQPDKEPIKTVPWTIQQTFLGIFLTIVPWIILALALTTLNTGTQSSKPLPPQTDLISAIVSFLFAVIIEGAFLIAPLVIAYRAFHYIKPHAQLALRALGFQRFSLGQTLFWIVIFMFAILAANNLYEYVITVLHLNLQTNDQVLLARSKEAPITTYATLLGAVIIAPICEETFFRGFVFPGLCRGMPVGWAIVISSLLFAVTHADPGSFLVLFLIGLALAFLRWHTNSIWPGIVLHTFNNSLAALVIILTMNGVIKP
jgi:membrane protease YdiL (CAAX protease family)